jgi:putative two-component system response regulator
VSAKDRPVILAVDDSTDLLALMERALRAAYTVVTAADGGAAIVAAEGEPRPDLILLDVDMPEVSGFEVCRALKAETRTADIPIVFLTGKNESEAQVEGFESGAVDYITKPINGKVLMARVRLHLALADRRLELERLVQERTAQLENTRTELIRRLGRVPDDELAPFFAGRDLEGLRHHQAAFLATSRWPVHNEKLDQLAAEAAKREQSLDHRRDNRHLFVHRVP